MQNEDDVIYFGTVGVYQCCHCGAYAKDEKSIKHHPICTMGKKGDTAPKEQLPYMFRDWYIPERMMPGIRRYIDHGIKPGRFLTAVFENNLTEALAQADEENLKNIQAYAAYLYNETPIACHGSKETVEKWIVFKKKGGER